MFKGRPKRNEVDKSCIVEAILKFKEKVYLANGEFAQKSDTVWTEISKTALYSVSALGVYTLVRKNYYNIHHLLGFIEKHDENPNSDLGSAKSEQHLSECSPSSESESENSSSTTNETEVNENRIKFTATLSSDEFKTINPHIKRYGNSSTSREYIVFQSHTWTHVINSHFYDQTKLPCTLVFKRAKVSKSGSVYATIHANCKECKSRFTGIIKDIPVEEKRVLIRCTYSGMYKIKHAQCSKRFLSGSVRYEATSKLLDSNMSASMFRRLEAHRTMSLGDCEPSSLPTLNVLRVAKSKKLEATHLDKSPIESLCRAQDIPPYQGVIRDIGHRRFFVHYWSSSQIHVYRAYCKLNSESKISIDSTGSVVRHIRWPTGQKSGHIFLYEVTVHDPFSSRQYSVCNMLSERHDTNSIYHWLGEWIRSGADTLKEIVTDMSPALMSAVVKAFTHFPSLTSYLKECSKILDSNTSKPLQNPLSYVRSDVAHTMKLMAGWSSIKGKILRTRKFYLRCMGQVIQSTSVNDLQDLLFCILTVAQSQTEGNDIITGMPTCTDMCKKKLTLRIGVGKTSTLDDIIDSEVLDESIQSSPVDGVSDVNELSFQAWVVSIADDAKRRGSQEGEIGNQQYLPELVNDIIHISRLIPMWTGIMVPIFGYGKNTASSAPVESSFNDLKHRIFAHRTLPMRVDDFVFLHIKAIDGAMKLAAVPSYSQENTEDGTEPETCVQSEEVINPSFETLTPSLDNQPSCPACKNGDFPSGAHRCKFCSIPVHIFPECSEALDDCEEGYGQQRMCRRCLQKGDTQRSVISELNEVENWRNMGIPVSKKRRKRQSYLEPNSEWLSMDLADARPVIPIGLLKNGHRLKPLRKDKKLVALSNTCAFDTLVQLTCVTYCDSVRMKSLIKNGDLPLFQLAVSVVESGIGIKTYRLRTNILSELFPSEELPNGVNRVDCLYSVEEMAKRVLTCHQTVEETSVCDSDHCPNKNRLAHQASLIVECDQVDDLQDKVQLSINISEESRCLANIKTECLRRLPRSAYIVTPDTQVSQCSGFRTRTMKLSKEHLLIDVSGNIVKDGVCNLVQEIQLASVPKRLMIEDAVFWLRGVSGYVGNTYEGAVGHYAAFCRRHDDHWEAYDDLQEKKVPISPSKCVRAVLIYYSIG